MESTLKSGIAGVCLALMFMLSACSKSNSEVKSSSISTTMNNTAETYPAGALDTVTLGGGCFWCVEAIYQRLDGVVSVASGYSGGTVAKPSYEQVCTGETGHAEVVQIVFDPKKLSLADLLEVFFTVHDPTTLNRQGADAGTQYRSVIFYRTPEQKATAEAAIKKAQPEYSDTIVTQISPFTEFYKAEEYHQNYYNRNTRQGYCSVVISPKIEKFMKRWKDKAKKGQ